MNILVCISNVPDTTSKINFTDSDSKFDKNGVLVNFTYPNLATLAISKIYKIKNRKKSSR